ncbi:cytochrome P450, partial [Paenibacillus elgii]|nr:cytochrome P450 [Paenibacillus elgii]
MPIETTKRRTDYFSIATQKSIHFSAANQRQKKITFFADHPWIKDFKVLIFLSLDISSRIFRDGKSLFENGLLNLDPPKHTQMRDIVNKAFTPRAMKDWEPRIQAITNELLDDIEGEREIDLVEQLSYPLPVR